MITAEEINIANSVFKLFLSLLLGSLVGLERRHKGQAAGMRTFALISMGACLAMIISIWIPQEYLGLKNGDPSRIAAQVVSGIGFLGAGAIIQMKGSVTGLTTAAGIWVTACVGLSVGAGLYIVSIVATLFIVVLLVCLSYLEAKLLGGTESKIIRIKLGDIVSDTRPFSECLERNCIHVNKMYLRYNYVENTTVINMQVRSEYEQDFAKVFAEIKNIGEVHSLTLTNELSN